jgi:ParB family transcriptional regulator, chromosome partitioning protein
VPGRTGFVVPFALQQNGDKLENRMVLKVGERDEWGDVEQPPTSTGRMRLPKPRRPILIEIDNIELGNGGRRLDDRKLQQLERSIADQGLLHPIHVYMLSNVRKGKFGLAAGQHRLRALKNLGYKCVSAMVIKREQAKPWRASENLHRNDLSVLEKSLAIVEYSKERQHLPSVKDEVTKGGKQPNDLGYTKLEKATGYDRKRIAEAYAHAALPKSIKKAILDRRKLNKRTTLNLLAKMETKEEQLRFIRGQSHAEPTKTKSTAKILKPTSSKQSESKWKGNMAVEALKLEWKASPFRTFYEKQLAGARKEFVRQMLH